MRRFYYILLSTIAITIVPASAIALFPQSLEAQENYINTTSESKGEHPLVCIVKVEYEICNSDYSEALFETKPNYDPECTLNCREPLECLVEERAQSTCSLSESPYKTIWWLW